MQYYANSVKIKTNLMSILPLGLIEIDKTLDGNSVLHKTISIESNVVNQLKHCKLGLESTSPEENYYSNFSKLIGLLNNKLIKLNLLLVKSSTNLLGDNIIEPFLLTKCK